MILFIIVFKITTFYDKNIFNEKKYIYVIHTLKIGI
jgi:hypothetical protein